MPHRLQARWLMTVRPGTVTIIRGGRLLDARAHRADPGDILVTGDTISEIGPPGLAAPAGAVTVDARGMLLHPGLINAHARARQSRRWSPTARSTRPSPASWTC